MLKQGFWCFADALNGTLINMFRPSHEIKKKQTRLYFNYKTLQRTWNLQQYKLSQNASRLWRARFRCNFRSSLWPPFWRIILWRVSWRFVNTNTHFFEVAGLLINLIKSEWISSSFGLLGKLLLKEISLSFGCLFWILLEFGPFDYLKLEIQNEKKQKLC